MLPENPCKHAGLACSSCHSLHTWMPAKKEGAERQWTKVSRRVKTKSSRQGTTSQTKQAFTHHAHHRSSPALLAAAAAAAAGAAARRAVASARCRLLACCLQIRSEPRQLVVQRLLLLSQHLLQFRLGPVLQLERSAAASDCSGGSLASRSCHVRRMRCHPPCCTASPSERASGTKPQARPRTAGRATHPPGYCPTTFRLPLTRTWTPIRTRMKALATIPHAAASASTSAREQQQQQQQQQGRISSSKRRISSSKGASAAANGASAAARAAQQQQQQIAQPAPTLRLTPFRTCIARAVISFSCRSPTALPSCSICSAICVGGMGVRQRPGVAEAE